MAIWWRKRQQINVMALIFALHFSWLSVGFVSIATPGASAATSQLYWSDPHTGIAIGGYDPVAYFIDGRARPGKPDFELQWGGGTWRFVNPGNREVFRRDPLVYAPRFGGYDPLQVARGFIAQGNPLIWTVSRQQLYLFFSLEQRGQWPADASMITPRVEQNWARLRRELVQ